jgi:hypothetical protein
VVTDVASHTDERSAQVPATQTCPDAHALPQLPQLDGSVSVTAQYPVAVEPPHAVHPG